LFKRIRRVFVGGATGAAALAESVSGTECVIECLANDIRPTAVGAIIKAVTEAGCPRLACVGGTPALLLPSGSPAGPAMGMQRLADLKEAGSVCVYSQFHSLIYGHMIISWLGKGLRGKVGPQLHNPRGGEHHNHNKESCPHNHSRNRALTGFTRHADSPKRLAPPALARASSLSSYHIRATHARPLHPQHWLLCHLGLY
jgi:hypothetical protein